mgnify:CR=1 FL=1
MDVYVAVADVAVVATVVVIVFVIVDYLPVVVYIFSN